MKKAKSCTEGIQLGHSWTKMMIIWFATAKLE